MRAWPRASLPLVAALVTAATPAQRVGPPPEELEGVGIEPHLDAQLPIDLAFEDHDGRPVTLRGYLERDRPVLLMLAYYHCPMLCNLLVDGAATALREVALEPGRDLEVVVVSIDPSDTPARARGMRQRALQAYGRGPAAAGWHFLTGGGDGVRALAEAVGYRYRWVEDRQEYAHGAGVFLITPAGRLSRFLAGVRFDPGTLRLGLVEASEGAIGSPLDQFVLFCFHYDADRGRYAPAARAIMTAGGALTVLVVGGWLLTVWAREARRQKRAAS